MKKLIELKLPVRDPSASDKSSYRKSCQEYIQSFRQQYTDALRPFQKKLSQLEKEDSEFYGKYIFWQETLDYYWVPYLSIQFNLINTEDFRQKADAFPGRLTQYTNVILSAPILNQKNYIDLREALFSLLMSYNIVISKIEKSKIKAKAVTSSIQDKSQVPTVKAQSVAHTVIAAAPVGQVVSAETRVSVKELASKLTTVGFLRAAHDRTPGAARTMDITVPKHSALKFRT